MEREIELKDLCRICAVGSESEAVYPLIVNNELTNLGEKFVSCLGIQIKFDEFPERICNYCQLQLNMFHAFMKKAKTSDETFFEILRNNTDEPILLINHDVSENEFYSIKKEEQDFFEENAIYSPAISQLKIQSTDVDFGEDANTQESTDTYIENDINNMDNIDSESVYSVEYLDLNIENENENKADECEMEPQNEPEPNTETIKPKARKRTYPYRCKNCSKRFSYKEVYEGHMRMHKGLPGFSCPHCPKTFNEKTNFDYHMQNHTNYRPAKCHLCEKSFKTKPDLASHIRCHNDIRKYMCDVCGKRFRSQSHMTYHRYSHFEERNFHCDQCTQTFKSPHVLKTHRNTVHSDICRYECEECGRKFKRDHHLVAHRRTHSKATVRKPRSKKPKVSEAEIIYEVISGP